MLVATNERNFERAVMGFTTLFLRIVSEDRQKRFCKNLIKKLNHWTLNTVSLGTRVCWSYSVVYDCWRLTNPVFIFLILACSPSTVFDFTLTSSGTLISWLFMFLARTTNILNKRVSIFCICATFIAIFALVSVSTVDGNVCSAALVRISTCVSREIDRSTFRSMPTEEGMELCFSIRLAMKFRIWLLLLLLISSEM